MVEDFFVVGATRGCGDGWADGVEEARGGRSDGTGGGSEDRGAARSGGEDAAHGCGGLGSDGCC